jgi:hypothetical protein
MLQTPYEFKLTKLDGFNPMSSKALDSLKQQATVSSSPNYQWKCIEGKSKVLSSRDVQKQQLQDQVPNNMHVP